MRTLKQVPSFLGKTKQRSVLHPEEHSSLFFTARLSSQNKNKRENVQIEWLPLLYVHVRVHKRGLKALGAVEKMP